MNDIVRKGRLGETESDVNHYLSSFEEDRRIFQADIEVGLAHTVMLYSQEIINSEVAEEILNALLEIRDQGYEELPSGYEDIHPAIEDRVIEKTGIENGGYLHTARSRNDEVAACIKITLRENVLDTASSLIEMRRGLLSRAEDESESAMPGYTHMQRAQPTTMAHHLHAYIEALGRDYSRLKGCYTRLNTNPLGAAAFSGTSHDIDPEITSDLLGFREVTGNTMDAVATRDYAIEALSNLNNLMTTISRLASELIHWSSQEYGFIEIPDEYSSTSSIMPQKKNPDTAELARARSATVQGALTAATGIMHGLPMSYNRDLQELTQHIWRGFDTAIPCIEILNGVIESMEINHGEMREALNDGLTGATDIADHLVREYSLSFREAHQVIAETVRSDGELTASLINEIALDKTGIEVSITDKKIQRLTDPHEINKSHDSPGAPGAMDKAIEKSWSDVEDDAEWLQRKNKELEEADKKLEKEVERLK